MPAAPALRRTPLNSVHRVLGARMVDFGGWDMPVQYSGIIDEHNAVRHAVGVFDVSHMGEIEIHGPEAAKLTDFVTTNAVHKLKPGQAHYSGLLSAGPAKRNSSVPRILPCSRICSGIEL